MKTFKAIIVLSILILSLFAVGGINVWADLFQDCYVVGEEYTNPGHKTFTFSVEDINGNYLGNYLRVKLQWNASQGISATMLHGLSIWPEDPNYFVVDNAIPDPNNNEPNLYGSFGVSKTWKHRDYKIDVQVFDVADNNSCGTGYVYARDKGKPKVTKFERYQK
jgi:hypothetical protein